MISSEKKTPSVFKHKYTSQNLADYFLEAAKNSQYDKKLNQFQDFAVRKLPQQFLLNLHVDLKQQLLERRTILYTFESQFIADFLNVFIGQKKRSTLSYQLSPSYYQMLTTEQIRAVGKKIPELFSNQRFLEKWFLSNYQNKYPVLTQNNEFLNFSEKEQKRRILQNIPEDL